MKCPKCSTERNEAIANRKKALAADPKFDFSAYNLAAAYREKGDNARALEYCQKYIEIKGKAITPKERSDIQSLIAKCRK
jgi:tetratricopeptide (TPR) repeat protein